MTRIILTLIVTLVAASALVETASSQIMNVPAASHGLPCDGHASRRADVRDALGDSHAYRQQ